MDLHEFYYLIASIFYIFSFLFLIGLGIMLYIIHEKISRLLGRLEHAADNIEAGVLKSKANLLGTAISVIRFLRGRR